MEQFNITIPQIQGGEKGITVKPGSSIVFVGANGSGKSRLTVYLEEKLGNAAHRLSAHRAQTLPKRISHTTELDALDRLRSGGKVAHQAQFNVTRSSNRWKHDPYTSLLSDFDAVVQALYAAHINISISDRDKGAHSPILTKFESLCNIWEQLLPYRHLCVSSNELHVVSKNNFRYNAADLSDGERAIFYMIGQTLLVDSNSLLIVDEPELHMHPSLMSKLWDSLVAQRQDIAFIFVTHDLAFAASRVAQKFVIRDYEHKPAWIIEEVPDNTGFSEETTTLILGSRHPVLFIEGTDSSLDLALYRSCFPDWTVIPRGSCEEVIHSVVTMRRNSALTRVTCSGIVDADAREQEEVDRLNKQGISILPVSEIENIILLPDVSRAIAQHEGLQGRELEDVLQRLRKEIFATLTQDKINAVVLQYCRCRIDRYLKLIDLSTANTVNDIAEEFVRRIGGLNINDIAEKFSVLLQDCLRDKDLNKLLAIYANKGLMQLAAKHLKAQKKDDFKSWLVRIMTKGNVPAVTDAIRDNIKIVPAQ